MPKTVIIGDVVMTFSCYSSTKQFKKQPTMEITREQEQAIIDLIYETLEDAHRSTTKQELAYEILGLIFQELNITIKL